MTTWETVFEKESEVRDVPNLQPHGLRSTTQKIRANFKSNLDSEKEQKIKSKSFRSVTAMSQHNQRKLPILISVFDEFKTADQIAQEIPRLGRTPKHHLQVISNRISTLRHRYTHPYLTSKNLVKGMVYKCSLKGRRIACELFYRLTHGFTLKWNGEYKIRCRAKKSKSFEFCPTCDYNPKRNSTYNTR